MDAGGRRSTLGKHVVVSSDHAAVMACVLQRGERRGTLECQPAKLAVEPGRGGLRLLVVGEPGGRWFGLVEVLQPRVGNPGRRAARHSNASTAAHANSPHTRGAAAGRSVRAPCCCRSPRWPQPAPLAALSAPPVPSPRHDDVRRGTRAWVVPIAGGLRRVKQGARSHSTRSVAVRSSHRRGPVGWGHIWEVALLATDGRAVASAAPREHPPWARTAAATRVSARPTWRRP